MPPQPIKKKPEVNRASPTGPLVEQKPETEPTILKMPAIPAALVTTPELPTTAVMLTFTADSALLGKLCWGTNGNVDSEFEKLVPVIRNRRLTTPDEIYGQAQALGIGGDSLRFYSPTSRLGEQETEDLARKQFSNPDHNPVRGKANRVLHLCIADEVNAKKLLQQGPGWSAKEGWRR